MILKMDILREITDEELDFIVDRLRVNLPYTIRDLYFINAARRHKELAKSFQNISVKLLPTFYTHRSGLKENCTIFGITGEADHTVFVFTFDESLNELRECLEATNLIRWTERVLFATIHKEHTGPVLDRVKKLNVNQAFDENAAYYWLSKEDALEFDIKTPQGTTLKELKEENVQQCNSLWEWRDAKSENFIRSLILLSGGFGLFDEKTDELLSFALINDHLGTGVLNTVEHARGKGYAEFIAKLMSRKIVEKFDLFPTTYINSLNNPSMALYTKLGYKKIGHCNWILIENK